MDIQQFIKENAGLSIRRTEELLKKMKLKSEEWLRMFKGCNVVGSENLECASLDKALETASSVIEAAEIVEATVWPATWPPYHEKAKQLLGNGAGLV